MFNRHCKNSSAARMLSALLALIALPYASMFAQAQPVEGEPVAYIGHGAMFDSSGSEISPSLNFISKAQDWYRDRLLEKLGKTDRAAFVNMSARVGRSGVGDEQSRLWANTQLLNWLLDRAKVEDVDRVRGKLNLMTRELQSKLPAVSGAAGSSRAERLDARERFTLHTEIERRLRNEKLLKTKSRNIQMLTTNTAGAAYRTLCSQHGVPLPVDFGPGSAWVARAVPGTGNSNDASGIIDGPDLFIVRSLKAQVLTLTSTTPPGMCIALPRFDTGNTVQADGVICLGQSDPLDATRAKACFWDNQDPSIPIPTMPGQPFPTFTFARSAAQSINQFAGGSDLRGGVGGVCSDCHAGENSYIIHGTVLNSLDSVTGALPALPTFAPTWYDPIVTNVDTRIWPQNPGPMNSPTTCNGCHGTVGAAGFAGRLPHLSQDLPGYCGSVLRNAVGASAPPTSPPQPGQPATNTPAVMPPFAPGSLACTPNVPVGDVRRVACSAATTTVCTPAFALTDPRRLDPAFPGLYEVRCTPELASLLSWCSELAGGDASGRGDPHIKTFNNVHYDFQSAGEFTYLRNGAGLEVQTRQTPVATAAIIGPDAHTGLTSCVSVNTAVAAQVGRHRVSYQPGPESKSLELRIDGKLTNLGKRGLRLGQGSRIVRSVTGEGIEIDFPDKTHLIVTPGFWGPPNNIWYFNVEALNTTGREGVMGSIRPGNWLPLLPDGTPLGARPASLADRYVVLNQKFADAWRVTSTNSLFDYAPGMSTANFTNRDWPPENPPCVIKGSKVPAAEPMPAEKARAVCGRIKDKAANAQCVFDVTLTGNAGFAKTYQLSQQLKQAFLAMPIP